MLKQLINQWMEKRPNQWNQELVHKVMFNQACRKNFNHIRGRSLLLLRLRSCMKNQKTKAWWILWRRNLMWVPWRRCLCRDSVDLQEEVMLLGHQREEAGLGHPIEWIDHGSSMEKPLRAYLNYLKRRRNWRLRLRHILGLIMKWKRILRALKNMYWLKWTTLMMLFSSVMMMVSSLL